MPTSFEPLGVLCYPLARVGEPAAPVIGVTAFVH
jgi:hypothetical protein